ncbi:subtilisin-like serine protease [Halovivax ruber XH-70]|uniref:Subtilisin-like serine protease n=1 Tax=Halovivax ruber (strain DSM 18193 / JCM 13892 / XH-70) TaxID=797302 RepID=L0I5U5_HALRX|nr:carboxypeptidase regulatory-like domain-containing protein [Halovivax ruber]AGB14890.1 subtilisin-like serine protease [Halovivax ruber XH-70]
MRFRADDRSRRTIAVLVLVAVLLGGVVAVDSAFAVNGEPQPDETDPAAGVEIDRALQTAEGQVEAIVRFESTDRATLAASANATETLKTKASTAQGPLTRFAARTGGVTVERGFWIANAALVTVDTERVSLAEIAAIDGVERIHQNFEVTTRTSTPASQTNLGVNGTTVSTSATGYTYGLEQINTSSVWSEFDARGGGAKVAVLDTGVDVSHPDIDLYTTNTSDPTYPGGWAEFDSNGDKVSGSQPHDTSSHGTHVTGTVSGGNASGTWIGVAPEAEMMHGLVLPDGSGRFSQIVAGMEWAVNNNADVVSMSLGTSCDPSTEDSSYVSEFINPVQNAETNGTVVVAASGNDYEGCSGSPANVYDSLAIGASNSAEGIADFSSGEKVTTSTAWGTTAPDSWPSEYIVPDVAAPGAAVKSSVPDGGYNELSGTSMATPHVAGVAALMESATERDLSPDEITSAIEASAWKPSDWDESSAQYSIEETGKDSRYGLGIVDAHEAVSEVLYGSFTGTVVDVTTGDPIPGANVMADNGSASFSGKTNANGAFEFEVPDNETYDVSISDDGYETVVEPDQTVDTNSDVDLGTVALTGNASLSGTVTDGVTDTAVENATVTATDPDTGVTYENRTDATGEYAFDAVRGGVDYSVTVRTAGYEDAETTTTVPDNGSATANAALTGDSTLTGTVTDAKSTPTVAIGGATITATGAVGSYTTTTERGGTYSLTLPGNETTYAVAIEADGYQDGGDEVTLNGGEESVNRALSGDSNISLSVSDSHFGDPVSNATVSVSTDSGASYPVTEAGDGTYDASTVPSTANYTITVEADGYEQNTTTASGLPPGGTAAHAVGLAGDATITGSITDGVGVTANGTALPIENATITLTRSDTGSSSTLANATGLNGSYAASVPGVETNYTINAAASGYQNTSLTTAELGDAETTTADLQLVGNATLSTQAIVTGERTANTTIEATTDDGGLAGVTWLNESAGTNLSVAVPGRGADYTVNVSSRAFSTNSSAVAGVTNATALDPLSISQLPYYFGIDDGTAPESITAGETVTVSATIVNLGTEDWNHSANLSADDTQIATRSIALNGTANTSDVANTTVSFSHQPGSTGPVAYTLETDNETMRSTVTVEETGGGGGGGFGPPPSSDPEPSFWLVGTALETDELVAGETGTVSVTVLNSGDGAGTKPLRLTADGAVVGTASVDVPAGERVEATLEFSFDEPGTYDLAVDGEGVGPVTVIEPPSDPGNETAANESAPTNDTDSSGGSDATPGFTAIAGLLALAIVAVARRR